jgi:anthranilate phosphoribosyltransferase
MPSAAVGDLAGGTAAENAAMIDRLLNGEMGPRRDIVLLNAGAALLVAGVADSLARGVQLAAASLDDGKARAALDRLRQVCA